MRIFDIEVPKDEGEDHQPDGCFCLCGIFSGAGSGGQITQ